MALTFTDYNIPLGTGFPMPASSGGVYDPSDYHFATRQYWDDTWPAIDEPPVGNVFYFHGSGADDYLTGPLLDNLITAGFGVVCAMALGSGDSTRPPFRFGYGNVNMPHFLSLFIKDAWWVESVVQYFDASYTVPTIVLGHSRGGFAGATWAAGYTGRTSFPSFISGILSSGVTVAGLGDLSWNDVNRNILTMSGVLRQIKLKAVLAWGDADNYAPPDYVRRLQSAQKPDTDNIYFCSAGVDADHSWTNSATYSPQAVSWVTQLALGAPIRDRSGNEAIPGATNG